MFAWPAVYGLSAASPQLAVLTRHPAVANATIGDPFPDDATNKLDFLTELVGDRDALEHGVDFGSLSGRIADRPDGTLCCKIEQGLEGVR